MAEESVTAPENVSALTEEVASPQSEKTEEPIADQDYPDSWKKLPEENKETQGLWTWDDVENHRKTGLTGAQSFKDAKTDDYGYLDVKLKMIRLRRLASSSTMLKGTILQGTSPLNCSLQNE